MSSEWPAPFQPVEPPPPARAAGWSTVDKLLIAAIALMVVIGAAAGYAVFLAPGPPLPTSTRIAQATTPPPTTTATVASTTAPPSASARPSVGTSPVPATASASGSQGPTETVPPDIAAQIDAVVATVPQVRQLAPTKQVPYFMVTRADFAAEAQSEFDKENDPADVAAQGRALERLGLLPPGGDLRQFILDLNSGAVAAFYRPDTGSFYIIERSEPFGPLDRVYVAHEYTHALQDQHFDLEANRIKDPAEGDAALAQLSVIEGDATNTMILWARQNLSVSELIEVGTSSLAQSGQTDLSNIPPILARQLNFPYAEGLAFATAVLQHGGWAAVNEAIQTPPASTEQVLHPEKYFNHETPTSVALPDASADLGKGWSKVFEQTFGEANLQVLLAGDETPSTPLTGVPVWPHADAAAGWAGDRMGMWEGPNGKWAIGWRLAWDTATDSDEFLARLQQVEQHFEGGATRVDKSNGIVQIVIGSDGATADAAVAALH